MASSYECYEFLFLDVNFSAYYRNISSKKVSKASGFVNSLITTINCAYVDSSMNHTERKTSATSTELYSPDANDNYKSVEADKLQTDKILKYVKDRLDELGLDNVTTETEAAPPQVCKNSRRLGCASPNPQLDVTSGENHELTSDVLMHRFTSDPGPPVTGKKVAFGKSLSVDPELTSNHNDLLFDICGQTNENRFPWLRDQGTQVDTEALSRNSTDKPGAHLFKPRGYTV